MSLTQAEIDRIRRLAAMQLPQAEIARQVGRARDTVRSVLLGHDPDYLRRCEECGRIGPTWVLGGGKTGIPRLRRCVRCAAIAERRLTAGNPNMVVL